MKTTDKLTAEDWVILRMMLLSSRPQDEKSAELHRTLEFLLRKLGVREVMEAMETLAKEGKTK